MGSLQGKITDYLPETKLQFTNAIRKQKLDKILNLIKTEPTISTNSSTVNVNVEPTLQPDISTPPPKILPNSVGTYVKSEVVSETAKTDISSEISELDVTQPPALNPDISALTPTTKTRDAVFEIPQAIRFPVNKNNSEVVLCKWASCGHQFDSNGKLLDHLKVSFPACLWLGKVDLNW